MEKTRFSGWFQFESAEEASEAVQEFPSLEGYGSSLVKAEDVRLEGDRVEIEVETKASEEAWEATIDVIVEFATPSVDGAFDSVHSGQDGDMVVTLTFDEEDEEEEEEEHQEDGDDTHDQGH